MFYIEIGHFDSIYSFFIGWALEKYIWLKFFLLNSIQVYERIWQFLRLLNNPQQIPILFVILYWFTSFLMGSICTAGRNHKMLT